MGTHTYAEVCNNVAYLDHFDSRLNISKYEEDPNVTEEEFARLDENGVTTLPHRWKKVGPGSHGDLNPDIWEKVIKYKSGKTKTIRVHLLNSSQYANVGEEEWVVFGDDRRAVERFLRDFAINEPISRQKAVTETN